MADSIAREQAIYAADSTDYTGLAIEDVKKVTDEVIKALKRLPSAEPEIVHCRECKHFAVYELKADGTDDKRYKPSVCIKGEFAKRRNPDWFCADGERENGR